MLKTVVLRQNKKVCILLNYKKKKTKTFDINKKHVIKKENLTTCKLKNTTQLKTPRNYQITTKQKKNYLIHIFIRYNLPWKKCC